MAFKVWQLSIRNATGAAPTTSGEPRDLKKTQKLRNSQVMRISVPKQIAPGETRVPLTPAVVKRITDAGVEVTVEAGAGRAAHWTDEQYTEVGATVAGNGEIWSAADLVVTLEPPAPERLSAVRPGAVLIGLLSPLSQADLVRTLCEKKVTSFAMEFLPRISRAQSMDVLSSQANLGGYKAVLLAAEHCPKMMPMMITAAGTIAPARVFVIGAGVAGLQAIATAKRLGAVVEAFDVRAATKEQVQSLGARFIDLPMEGQEDKATGGYAKQQTDEQRRKQSALMSKHVIGADIVISTAAVFGKAPPMLIPADTVAQMNTGSVVVDMAASAEHGRGNCEATRPGQTYTTDNGVVLIGPTNLPAMLPLSASQVYANNMHAFLKEIIDEGQLKLNLEDEIQKGAAITHDGQVVNPLVQEVSS